MKAIVYSQVGQRSHPFQVTQRSKPILSPTASKKVICQVEHASLNPVDAKWLVGDKLPEFFAPAFKWLMNGNIAGIDFSGIVVKASLDSDYPVGSRVFGTAPINSGSFAEYIVPTSTIALIPSNVSSKQAAAIPLVGLSAVQLFRSLTPNLTKGQHVLLVGGPGGTGHVFIQYARNYLGAIVTAICSKKNEAFVKSLGANVVCYDCPDEEMFAQLYGFVEGFGPISNTIDTVFSNNRLDQTNQYQSKLMNPSAWYKLTATCDASSGSTERIILPLVTASHVYITLGGSTLEWTNNLVKQYLHVNFLPTTMNKLFWVHFGNTTDDLNLLSDLLAKQIIRIQLEEEPYPITQDAVDTATQRVLGCRTVGKILF